MFMSNIYFRYVNLTQVFKYNQVVDVHKTLLAGAGKKYPLVTYMGHKMELIKFFQQRQFL